MKKFFLLIVFMVALLLLLAQYFTLKSARSADGAYNVVLVNKKSGDIYRILGK